MTHERSFKCILIKSSNYEMKYLLPIFSVRFLQDSRKSLNYRKNIIVLKNLTVRLLLYLKTEWIFYITFHDNDILRFICISLI